MTFGGWSLALSKEREAVLAAVIRAGALVVSRQAAILSSLSSEVVIKEDGSLLTSADLASERELLDAIALSSDERCRVWSEEGLAPSGHNATPRKGHTWYVDPLDGSRSYVAGSTDYAILVSQWMETSPAFSVVSYPAIGDIAVAVGRALEWRAGGPVSPSGTAERAAIIYNCYDSSDALRRLVDTYAGELRENDTESTRALFDVAVGRADAAVVLLCGHKAWDIAALLHVLMAGGASVSSERGQPVMMDDDKVDGQYVIAARDPNMHRELLAIVGSA